MAIMDIKIRIVEICSRIFDIQDNTRLTRFLICYSKLDAKAPPTYNSYMQLAMKATQVSNPKKFEKQMQ
jgi:hypothetical protein